MCISSLLTFVCLAVGYVSAITTCPDNLGFTRFPGSDRCFKLFTDIDRNWYDSMTKCREEGLIMVKTTDKDAAIIREGLINKYGEGGSALQNSGSYAWLDAKYNGERYVWNDGEKISYGNGLWHPGHPELKPDYCMLILNAVAWKYLQPSKPYWTTPCTHTRFGRKAFCELI